jgi:hypothetical protein
MLTGLAIPCFTASYKVVNFPHDPLSPLHCSCNHRFCSRAAFRIEQIISCLEMTSNQNSRHDCEHTLSTFVHSAGHTTLFAFVRN